MTNTISNMDDVIDSRDIIERIEELEGERDSLQSDYDEKCASLEEAEKTNTDYDNDPLYSLRNAQIDAREAIDVWNESEEAKELAALLSVQEEAEGYAPDWKYGVTLIRDSYFEQAMDEMIEDCYGEQYTKDLPSFMTITLDYVALQSDYTSVDFDGVTYWIR
jgi:hypothetical protein